MNTDGIIKYEVIIYWSHTYRHFIAEVPELSGCMADGVTYEETLANVKAVMQEWIETAQQRGWNIPEPKGKLMYA